MPFQIAYPHSAMPEPLIMEFCRGGDIADDLSVCKLSNKGGNYLLLMIEIKSDHSVQLHSSSLHLSCHCGAGKVSQTESN